MDLKEELDRIDADLAAARLSAARLSARIDGLVAERAALAQAVGLAPEVPEQQVGRPPTTKKMAIVAILQGSPEPLRINDILDGLHRLGRSGDNYNGVSVYLNSLLKDGSVERVGYGLYSAKAAL